MKVYCIIVTYNGMKWVERCLSSIRAGTYPMQVIVVDNLSSDSTVDYIKNHFSEVILIESGANLGFGKANNIGIRRALSEGADYVFLLNQDTWIMPSSIEALVRVHDANKNFGIVSPMHISSDEQSLEYKFKEYIQLPYCEGMVSDLFLGSLKPVYETQFVNAAAWLVSKNCLETVGGFDPLFPHYGEDVDYIKRAQFFGFKVGITPHSNIFHDSKFQTWPEIMWNKKRMLTIYLSEIKSIGGTFRSSILVFLKRRFDDLTSHLLYRRFKLFAYHAGLTLKVLKQLSQISKARKASLVKGAFLIGNQ